MNIFISQPMKGRSVEEINREREPVIELCKKKFNNANIINSFISDVGSMNSRPHPLSMLGDSIKRMSEADAVVFVGDWENARGCKVEHLCATNYGIITYECINGHIYQSSEVRREVVYQV